MAAQIKAVLSVNRELILLYWQIGRDVLRQQKEQGWGAKVIDRLAKDLNREFPEMKGFSSRNLKYMRAFAESYPDEQFVQQLAARIRPVQQDFKPEFAGKMNFYLSALDDLLRHPDDQPSVDIILCKGKNKTIAEYALRDVSKPIGVSEYQLTTKLPQDLAKALPTARDLERLMEEER
jgi:hypothetical protein